jgi:hypothetical protein
MRRNYPGRAAIRGEDDAKPEFTANSYTRHLPATRHGYSSNITNALLTGRDFRTASGGSGLSLLFVHDSAQVRPH